MSSNKSNLSTISKRIASSGRKALLPQQMDSDKLKQLMIEKIRNDKDIQHSISNIVTQEKNGVHDDDDIGKYADAIGNVLLGPILEMIEQCVKSLEQRMDDLERYNRTWCVRLLGVPEKTNEDTTAIFVNTVNQHLDNVSISNNDIENSHRIGKRSDDKNRPIIVRFYSRPLRLKVLRASSSLKRKKLSMAIVEDLTQKNLRLFYDERNKLQGDDKKSIITRNGRVYRRTNDSTSILIT
ncbi:unnamed protein product [Didymodactylos carnosus]|uniref:Uncharacterized protein n=1 Tax=Didymodactylos carnosus TaxID=1234261 RepID=A0A815N5P4_9BILA|nr:unnamed protein product [Didymodactylos carnosus]CAF4311701.1 unnamed protein product [Didymodactylos carnosus]